MYKLKTVQEYQEFKQGNTVFLFSANWCPDCRYIEPFLPEVEKEFSSLTFVYVDRDQFIDICIENGVLGIPSFIVYKNGEVTGTFISKLRKTKQEIIDFLNTVV
jgi:thiol-disulfide isomerase/thioredoxin